MSESPQLFRLTVLTLLLPVPAISNELTQTAAREQLIRVVDFYRTKVGYEGAYLWKYSADLTHQEGEGIATRTSGWTQPPGAPTVGEAYLEAWRLSGEQVCLDAAVEVAHALIRSQLKSGGWSSHFDLGPKGRSYAYRMLGDKAGRNNRTTFDDNKSQSALMLIMHVDEELEFKDAKIHEAVGYALQQMLASQYPNGAWPQQYSEPPDPGQFPVLKASYPDNWSREWPKPRYTEFYTLNDNNMSHIVDMLFEAERIYDRKDCRDAAIRTGEFFLMAQMPEPQPGWAQQYDRNMHPAWARKFEPAAVTGGESQAVMRTLLRLYQFTADRRFADAVPPAIAYYQKSQLEDGKLARFYELKTNRPLFFTKDYQLTYSDADMPTHYSFKVGSRLDSIEQEWKRLNSLAADDLLPKHTFSSKLKRSRKIQERAEEVVNQLDSRGAWVETGKMRHTDSVELIDMNTYTRNLKILAAWAGAK